MEKDRWENRRDDRPPGLGGEEKHSAGQEEYGDVSQVVWSLSPELRKHFVWLHTGIHFENLDGNRQ